MIKKKRPGDKVEFGILPEFLGYHIRMAQIGIFRDFARNLDEYAISPTLFGSLVIIQMNPGIKQSELAEAVQLDRSSVVPMIDRLEKKGYVVREKPGNDRRSNALSLTSKGEQLLGKIVPLVREHEKRLTGALTNEEESQLVKLLGKLIPG